jgi:hypothetical protein
LSGKNEKWEKMCVEIQRRSLSDISLKPKSVKALWAEILNILTLAYNDKKLTTKPHEIRGLLKLDHSTVIRQKSYWDIMGGEKNQDRIRNIPHFSLTNGCWFDFAILVYENNKEAEIVGFNFEIRFPEKMYSRFLRIDFNTPNHDNDDKNMRLHLHPGHDDIMIHSPPMSPIEILYLFLYGIDIPDNPRAYSNFRASPPQE